MPSPSQALELEKFLHHRLSVLAQLVSESLHDLYAGPFGLTVTQWRVMAALGRFAPLTASDVGQRIVMDKVAVSRAVAGLMKRGLVERADLDPNVHVILVSGRGEGFCAGFDLSAYADGTGSAGGAGLHRAYQGTVLDGKAQAVNHLPNQPWDPMIYYQMMSRFVRGFSSLMHADKPTVVKVHGYCVAGGTDIALQLDAFRAAVDAFAPPTMLAQLAGSVKAADLAAGGYFTMGRWGLLVNVVAVLWGAGMALNLAWPREAVYGTPWYNTWGAFAYTGVILGTGLLWYGLRGRHHIGTLASHALAGLREVAQAKPCRCAAIDRRPTA